jgi:hypothetical protein
MGLDT